MFGVLQLAGTFMTHSKICAKKRRPMQDFQKEIRAISEVNAHAFDKA